MEWLFIIGLVAAVLGLMRRLNIAESRIGALEASRDTFTQELNEGMQRVQPGEPIAPPVPPQSGPEPEPRQQARRASVPKTSRREDREDAVTLDAPSAPPEREPAFEPPPEQGVDTSWRPSLPLDLEDVFGRRLPIWAGGITLAVAGVFLVRYSIERGLITPLLRVIMAFIFGFGLLVGAEAAYRFRERVADPRVGQALAGAGLATLYAAFYLAGTQYGLIGQTLAFLGLAAVTAGAIVLSFRFGLPSAVLGLVGGFAAPALVGGEDANLPLLSLYLGLVTAGLVLSGRGQRRPWMGMAALGGGLGWGAILLLSTDFGLVEALALGLYLIVLGAVIPVLAGTTQFERPLRLGASLLASIQLAWLVDQAGYSPLTWALYLLLGATLAFFTWRRPDLRESNAIAAAVALLLLAQWDGASGPLFAIVAVAIASVFAGVPLALTWRNADRDIDGWQIAVTAAGLAAIANANFGELAADRVETLLAATTLALAALPATAAWLARARAETAGLAIQIAVSAALVFAAVLLVTPGWAAPLAGAAVFAGVFAALRGRTAAPLEALLWGAATIVGAALLAHFRIEQEVQHLFGWSQHTRDLIGAARWLALTAVLVALAWREQQGGRRRIAEAAAALAVYGALAQILPRDMLAWSAALLAIALQFGLRERVTARVTALAVAAGWALEPLAWWLGAGLESLGADPVLLPDLPALWIVATRLLPVLAAQAIVRFPLPRAVAGRIPPAALALPVALVAGHILFKQVFAVDSAARFVTFGLAERTIWEAILLAAAWTCAKGVGRIGSMQGAALCLAGAALAHFAVYTALLHNPLWASQALGPLPLANLGAAAYGVAIATALSLRRWSPARLAPAFDGAVLVLACLAVLTLLRQAFAGSVPAGVPLSQSEDLLRSLAGILLALGFLWVGSRRGERSWRLGSLAIMLLAVAKVFLVDAAGLDGLLRVASFMALGFSLIGIGWVYSRQLRARPVIE
ncbi:MAG: DUF2339 domain-containing protein [Altererythrobacter sp.]|nr:DUF2339 domain-containing protein [Altererythrobacter sp.]